MTGENTECVTNATLYWLTVQCRLCSLVAISRWMSQKVISKGKLNKAGDSHWTALKSLHRQGLMRYAVTVDMSMWAATSPKRGRSDGSKFMKVECFIHIRLNRSVIVHELCFSDSILASCWQMIIWFNLGYLSLAFTQFGNLWCLFMCHELWSRHASHQTGGWHQIVLP